MNRLGLLTVIVAALALGGCNFLGIGGSTSKLTAHPQSVFQLHVGQCLNPPKTVEAEVTNLDVISCSAPHTQQVFALVTDNAGDDYPGSDKLQTFANAMCLQHFASFVGIPYQESSLFYTYLLPSVRSWAAGDRTVTCVLTTTGLKLTASAQGSKR